MRSINLFTTIALVVVTTVIGYFLGAGQNVVDGESETILETTWDALQGQKPLAINVHESQVQMQNYIACADL